MSAALQKLKRNLGQSLIDPNQVQTQPGLPTGLESLDHFLLWGGLPQGELSLFGGAHGLGKSTLWTLAARKLTGTQKWVALIEDNQSCYCPWSFHSQGGQSSHLLSVSNPDSQKKLFWALQEMISLSMFELIGCNLGDYYLREFQLQQLRRLVRRHQTALVFFSQTPPRFISPSYALVLQFNYKNILIQRALHRPTPYNIERSCLYAHFMPQLTQESKPSDRRKLSHLQSSCALSRSRIRVC